MKIPIINEKGQQGERVLPAQFAETVRPDLIARAVRALHAAGRQPYGADPRAGKRASAELSRRRRKYRGSYGHGISRVPRKILSRRGVRMFWVGAFAPGTVGGRRAHAPKASKSWFQKVNTKERRKAIRCALAATVDRSIVAQRGHKIPEHYPCALAKRVEDISTTKQLRALLVANGFGDDLKRAESTTVRAGKATMRGRKTRRATSLLIIVSKESPILKAAQNLPGVDAVIVNALNASLLAPGTHAGRATLFTEEALERMEKEQLFTDRPRLKAPKQASNTPEEKAKGGKAPVKPSAKSEAPSSDSIPVSPAKVAPVKSAGGEAA